MDVVHAVQWNYNLYDIAFSCRYCGGGRPLLPVLAFSLNRGYISHYRGHTVGYGFFNSNLSVGGGVGVGGTCTFSLHEKNATTMTALGLRKRVVFLCFKA